MLNAEACCPTGVVGDKKVDTVLLGADLGTGHFDPMCITRDFDLGGGPRPAPVQLMDDKE
jgi:hypothetical protein